MGSSCSSSQSAKDSASIKSEDLAMETASIPEKTDEDTFPAYTKIEPRPKLKGPPTIESEYSSACEDGMPPGPGGLPQLPAPRTIDPPPATLPSLARLSPALCSLLEGKLGEAGEAAEGEEDAKEEGDGARCLTLYICAGEDSIHEVHEVLSRVVPPLRLRARALGWDVAVVLGPLVEYGNCDRTVTARDVMQVAHTALSGANGCSPVIPLVFLHDCLGTPVLPVFLPATIHQQLQAALTQANKTDDLLLFNKCYRMDEDQRGPREEDGDGRGGGEEQCVFLCPVVENYPDYEGEVEEARAEARRLWAQDSTRLLELLENCLPQEAKQTLLRTPLEMELGELARVLAPGSDGVWVSRRWSGGGGSGSLGVAAERLQVLQATLKSQVQSASVLQYEVPWPGGGDDGRGGGVGRPDGQYLAQLCAQLSSHLTTVVQRIAAQRQCAADAWTDVPRDLLCDLRDHRAFYRRTLTGVTPQDAVLEQIKSYATGPCRGLLGVFSEGGGGVTTLLATAAAAAKEWLPGAIVVVRSVGATGRCSSLAATVRSIAGHLCELYGGNAADCSLGSHQTRQLLVKAMSSATSACPLLLLLDGLNHAPDMSSDLTWLPVELPEHVKMVVGCAGGGDVAERLRSMCSSSGMVVDVPPLTKEEVAGVLRALDAGTGVGDGASGAYRTLRPGQVEAVAKDAVALAVTPLQLVVGLREWQMSGRAGPSMLLPTTGQQISALLDTLQHIHGKVFVGRVFALLTASVRGLTSTEILDLLSCDADVMRQIFSNSKDPAAVHRFPSAVWLSLLHDAAPLLRVAVVAGAPLLRWRCPQVRDRATAAFLPSQETLRLRCAALAEYFQGTWDNGGFLEDKATGAITNRHCPPQPFTHRPPGFEVSGPAGSGTPTRIGGGSICCSSGAGVSGVVSAAAEAGCGAHCRAANRRRMDEEPRAVLRSCPQSALAQAVERYTLDPEWLTKKLAASDTEQVLGDIDVALTVCGGGVAADLRLLRIALSLSAAALDYDHRQFYAQIYGRLHETVSRLPPSECSHMRKILSTCLKPPLHSLLPLTTCFVQPAKADSEDPVTCLEVIINHLSRLPRNPAHVIALSTTRGTLMVWDVHNRRPVRTLKGLHMPRRFEMIDDFQCLLLCGRELRIYNLDNGELIIKFREVMNQKMPFFGLHRPDHVVALSRSRMYVNMMNISNGECVATFKVGEDRFLNSLTVSENGRTCVCGDDTPKASALLVWELSQRKLRYDLRIPNHEFLTRMAAITSEGHYVACVCRETEESAPNFLVVYDLESGTLFKRWKPGVSSIGLAISTPGVCVIASLEDATVTAYDLVTGNPRWTARGHTYPVDTIRVDPHGAFVVTYDSTGHDRAIRMWDMQTGQSMSVWWPDCPVTACEVSADGRAVVVALSGRSDVVTLVCAHRLLPPLPQQLDEPKTEDAPYGDPANHGKEFDLS